MLWGFDVSGHRSGFWADVSRHGSVFGLVVFGGVDGVLADDFSGCFVDGEGLGPLTSRMMRCVLWARPMPRWRSFPA